MLSITLRILLMLVFCAAGAYFVTQPNVQTQITGATQLLMAVVPLPEMVRPYVPGVETISLFLRFVIAALGGWLILVLFKKPHVVAGLPESEVANLKGDIVTLVAVTRKLADEVKALAGQVATPAPAPAPVSVRLADEDRARLDRVEGYQRSLLEREPLDAFTKMKDVDMKTLMGRVIHLGYTEEQAKMLAVVSMVMREARNLLVETQHDVFQRPSNVDDACNILRNVDRLADEAVPLTEARGESLRAAASVVPHAVRLLDKLDQLATDEDGDDRDFPRLTKLLDETGNVLQRIVSQPPTAGDDSNASGPFRPRPVVGGGRIGTGA